MEELAQARLRQLSRDGEADADVIDELTSHLKDRYDEAALRRRRRSRRHHDDAERAERWPSRRSGTLETPRRSRTAAPPAIAPGARPLAGVWRDLHFGARLLARTPGTTAIVAATLALGIAANTIAFSIINGLPKSMSLRT